MIPLRDTIPSRTAPVVTVLLLVANAAVFGYEVLAGPELPALFARWAFIPVRLFSPSLEAGASFGHGVATIFSSMFLHGSLGHLLGNMLFLWIFGDNVEDALGHLRYLAFYLASGAAAALLQGAFMPLSQTPNVGASGAIAGVLGGYFLLYPRARVLTLVPLFFLFPLVEIPAALYLVFWFVMQFFMGASSLAGASEGGVAWWAHVGGFVAGLLLVRPLRPRRRPAVRVFLR